MNIFEIYVGGEFCKSRRVLEVFNPYNNEIIAQTYLCEQTDLEQAIEKALLAEEQLKSLPSYIKYEALMQIAGSINENRKEFAELLCLESAKPIKYALGEIDRAIQTFIIAAEESKRLPREYIDLEWTPAGAKKEGLIKYFPVGLIAGIAPFNFPLNLAVHKIAPAIASGCPIILKPSTSTPLSTLKLARVIDKTNLPKGAVSVLPMDRKTGNQLVTDERFKLLSFTGSPEVGWKMKKDAGKKKVVLELGGNAGVIITGSADLDVAVKKCIIGGFAYSGQVCIHAQRIYVHDKVFKEFTERFIKEIKKLKPGKPMNIDTDISAMIDEANAIRVEDWVNEAVKDGAKILTGGIREKAYYPPTVLSETHKEMKVCALEVFGPVVTLEPYKHFEAAVNHVNEGRFGLQAGIFTDNLDEINFAFFNLDVGGVIINDVPTFRVDNMPYGGIKNSGLGREGVKYAIFDMMEAKILVKNF
ncbi:MAG: aldehyde dehydrogenase family protein [Bacteroidetes bacterium]|nr:aldehyde dehydrogenase family protein [Bacteroidota bacterium]MBL7105296.1 aldehyde dehydrogenase family protein [Bacteroidales bacterium]